MSALATQEGLVGQSCHYYRIQLYHPRRVLKIVESSTNITVILDRGLVHVCLMGGCEGVHDPHYEDSNHGKRVVVAS